uniref:Large ribosomal subunit protein bL33m n=1 Tax=Podarcis muralis TaxID=64176 RepID=A0A670HNK7_PODMU
KKLTSAIVPLFVYLSRYILVRMLSEAGTGFAFNMKRGRLEEKLVKLKYDPIGKKLGDLLLNKRAYRRV